jgi:hypothetical protein
MASFDLVSWENEKIQFEEATAAAIKFLEQVPEPGEEVKLSGLEIDIHTLMLVKKFLEIKGEFPKINKPLPASRTDSIFDQNSPYNAFFKELNNDELLLLTLAAHKLTIESLQELCTAVIASHFAEMDATEVMNDLSENELTTNEEDYYKWTGFQWH